MDDAVIQAVLDCDPAALQILLDRGANAEAQDGNGWSALRRAALRGCCSVTSMLLAYGASVEFGGKADDGTAPLLIAAANGHQEVVKLLLDGGADVNRKSDTVTLCPTALMAAALKGHVDIVCLLLEHGANTESRGYRGQTALSSAWNPPVVRLLLDHGADINARDNDGETALTLALHELNHEEYYEGMQETVNLLQQASSSHFTPI